MTEVTNFYRVRSGLLVRMITNQLLSRTRENRAYRYMD